MTPVSVAHITDALARAGLLVESCGALPATVTSIADDSRATAPGGVFIAVRGVARDGHDFIGAATAAGATLILLEDTARLGADGSAGPGAGAPASIVVRDSRRAAAIAAQAFYGNPGAHLSLVGVTGTNGKTTTVGMLRHLLDGRGALCASIGTLGVLVGSAGVPLAGGRDLTTPGPVELQRVLRALVDQGVTHVAMEVSSHALDQRRVEGLGFSAAVFTNLTRDHLDYHGTMEAYLAAKLQLVQHLGPTGVAVRNADDSAWSALDGTWACCSYGVANVSADVTARDVQYHSRGTTFVLHFRGQSARTSLPLIGDFNVMNALAASAAVLSLGQPVAQVAAGLATMPQVPGRLEIIAEHPTVLRDYAHTPDALQRALTALRPFVPGRLIVVFGAGGDRDRGKRPMMARVAESYADVMVVTSDNPRTEDPDAIIDEIVAPLRAGQYERVEDRRAAIARALAIADTADDVVLLAGKGHETYQIRGTEKKPFDERVIVQELLLGGHTAT